MADDAVVPDHQRIAVAVVNDYEIVVDGVAGMLGRFPADVDVCERIIIGEPIDHPPIDVALYDTYGRVGIAAQALEKLQRHRDVLHVAMFSLDLPPELVREARDSGASGCISKTLSAGEVVAALVRVSRGEVVVARGVGDAPAVEELDWPGKDAGLSQRESQVLVLAAEGLTNAEIGQAVYLGFETVKTHLSRAYRKLGVHNRMAASRFVFGTGAFERFRPAEDALDDATDDEPT